MISLLLSPSSLASAKPANAPQARLIAWPDLKMHPPDSWRVLDEAIENIFGYDWLILKNRNAAGYFLDRFEEHLAVSELDELRVMAIDDDASGRLTGSQIHVDITLDKFSVSKVIEALEAYAGEVSGLNLLVPSAGLVTERFESQLIDRGARVDGVVAYRTTTEKSKLTELKAMLVGGGIDWIVFTGPAELSEFADLVDSYDLPWVLSGVAVACCGQETEAAAIRFGLSPSITGAPDPEAVIQLLLTRV